jgi:hypothetical protein
MFYLEVLCIANVLRAAAGLVGKFEPTRLLLGWQGIRKARPEDIPAVVEALAKWRSPQQAKRK